MHNSTPLGERKTRQVTKVIKAEQKLNNLKQYYDFDLFAILAYHGSS